MYLTSCSRTLHRVRLVRNCSRLDPRNHSHPNHRTRRLGGRQKTLEDAGRLAIRHRNFRLRQPLRHPMGHNHHMAEKPKRDDLLISPFSFFYFLFNTKYQALLISDDPIQSTYFCQLLTIIRWYTIINLAPFNTKSLNRVMFLNPYSGFFVLLS